MGVLNSSRSILGDDILAVYKLLAYLPIRYCVDVGAAAGGVTQLIKRSVPNAIVDAFEPFPGNIPFFEKNTAGLDGVRLHQAAVSTNAGIQELITAATVQGNEPGWEDKVGYSSGSRLAQDTKADNTIDVNCVRIDDVCPDSISFLKIDVQGTEADVLASAKKHFDVNQVDMCYVEMDGDQRILDFFEKYRFHVYATPTLLPLTEPIELDRFETVIIKNMSNGLFSQYVWDNEAPSDAEKFAEYILGLRKELRASVQTDLICVAPHFHETFLLGAESYRQSIAR